MRPGGQHSESDAVAELSGRLQAAYPDADPHRISELINSLYCYDGARIRNFIPILIERRAHEVLSVTPSAPDWAS